jgi:CheY-like chemotaxis protein
MAGKSVLKSANGLTFSCRLNLKEARPHPPDVSLEACKLMAGASRFTNHAGRQANTQESRSITAARRALAGCTLVRTAPRSSTTSAALAHLVGLPCAGSSDAGKSEHETARRPACIAGHQVFQRLLAVARIVLAECAGAKRMSTATDMAPESRPSPKKVLLVDDDENMLRIIGSWIQGAGHEVVPFNQFADAKSYLTASKPDAIIADVRLGAFNGLQLVIQAKLEHPEIKAVVLTGFYDAVLASEVSKLGAAYLVKPIRSEQLLEKLR